MKKFPKTFIRIIKYCAQSIVGLMLVAEAYLFIVRPDDDIAGGVFMGLLAIFVFGVIAIAATRSEILSQNTLDT